MQLNINGQLQQLDEDLSVAALTLKLGLNVTQIAVERNGGIVPKSAYAEVRLQDGDVIEIVQFIGGG